MSLVSEAIARYHKLIESEPYIDLAWAHALQDRIKAAHLSGRPISPVLRPHFITNRDYLALTKASETVLTAVARVGEIAMANPALLARTHMLPAERMLAGADPGYPAFELTALLDTAVNEGSLRVSEYGPDLPLGVIYSGVLSDLYYDAPPVKEFRKKYGLKKIGGWKHLLTSILKVYKEWGGKNKRPNIAIVELRQPFQPASASDFAPLAEFFTQEGYTTEIVPPEQLEYRNNVLSRGEFTIDIVYRRVRLQEFLVRFDLNHPLVRAYKDHTICMLNSFRTEVASKKAMFDLLTDEAVTAKFPAAEKKAIKDFIPWTRIVQAAKTTYNGKTVDLPEFVLKHRAKLVIKPNDDHAEVHPVRGAEVDDTAWERALRLAMRTPSVVQEAAAPAHAVFPMLQYGNLMMKDMVVHTHPHAFLGKVTGASSWLSAGGNSGFSTLTGLAPMFVLEGK